MNFYWVYDLPNWLFGTLVVAVFVTFSIAGHWLTRPLFLRLFGKHVHNDIVSFFLAAVGVFYGITLGLIAVGTYTTYSAVDSTVGQEAASLAAIYRDVSGYPEPVGTVLRREVEEYTDYIIDQAWPQQKKGTIPVGGNERVTKLQKSLAAFNPSTEGEKIVHAEAMRQFNSMVILRRLRLQSVKSGLPASMYSVIVIGALLNIMVSWLFAVENRNLHGFLNVTMAALLGLLVYLIAAMDNPFRGDFSVGPDAFVEIRDQLMKPATIVPVTPRENR